LQQGIWVEFIKSLFATEAVLEVVSQHNFDRAYVYAVQIYGLDFQVGMAILLNILKLIVTHFLHQLIVNFIDILQICRNVFWTNEFVVVSL
jgi:hypothetical protein